MEGLCGVGGGAEKKRGGKEREGGWGFGERDGSGVENAPSPFRWDNWLFDPNKQSPSLPLSLSHWKKWKEKEEEEASEGLRFEAVWKWQDSAPSVITQEKGDRGGL